MAKALGSSTRAGAPRRSKKKAPTTPGTYKRSRLELELERQLNALKIAFVVEYKFSPVRRWRFDFAWPQAYAAAEVQGGTWRGGRHTRGAGYEGDCAKYNAATLMGWKVLQFTSRMVKDGTAAAQIAMLLGASTPLSE